MTTVLSKGLERFIKAPIIKVHLQRTAIHSLGSLYCLGSEGVITAINVKNPDPPQVVGKLSILGVLNFNSSNQLAQSTLLFVVDCRSRNW